METLDMNELETIGGFNGSDFWTGVALWGTVLTTAATAEVSVPVGLGIYAIGAAGDYFLLHGLGIPMF